MTIRITTQMTSDLYLNSINSNLSNIYDLYAQISSGKSLTSVSQDPVAATKVIGYNVDLGKLSDYSNNIASASEEIDVAYDTLDLINDNLTRINELTIQASSSVNSEESLEAIRLEIEQRTQTIADLANTQYQGKYIFAGTNTSSVPYTLDEDLNPTYNGTSDEGSWERSLEISSGTTMTVNINGESIFGDETSGIFATLAELNSIMSDPDSTVTDISNMLGSVQEGLDSVISAQSSLSSKAQRLDATLSINESMQLSVTSAKSALEDTDLTEAASELTKYQTALEASMTVSSTMLQQISLLNYL